MERPVSKLSRKGRWVVTYSNLETNGTNKSTFDGVLVCTGHHASKNIPQFHGIENFKGRIVHSRDYREPSSFADKNVLVIGIGNSGGDISVELSPIASKVNLSSRSGTWVLHRVSRNGLPFDIVSLTRFNTFLFEASDFTRKLAEWDFVRQLSLRIDHALYGLQPKNSVLGNHPFVNDAFPNAILSGMVTLRPDVLRFGENWVEFTDGSVIKDLDCIMLATGYVFGFPFLDESIVKVDKNRVNLYKFMFPPHLQHDTLAIIGCFQPFGAINPTCELQARLAVRVFMKATFLPDRPVMFEDIRNKASRVSKMYLPSDRHTIEVNYVSFSNELSELIGCKPHIWSYFLSDPKLFIQLLFGPVVPYQFRLEGPRRCTDARRNILSVMERIAYPMSSRKASVPWKAPIYPEVKFFIFLFSAIIFIVAYFIFSWLGYDGCSVLL